MHTFTEPPPEFAAAIRATGPEDAEQWLARLPALVAGFADRWRLSLDGPTFSGYSAVVLLVHRADGEPAALKVGRMDGYTAAEGAALRLWGGQGAVRLLGSAEEPERQTCALLLERLDPARNLFAVSDDEGAEVVGKLIARLGIVAPQPSQTSDSPEDRQGPLLPTLADDVAQEVQRLPEDWERLGRPCPRAMIDYAVDAYRDLGAEGGDRLLHVDLHQMNVLAAAREPWLAIDPQARIGDPAFTLLPFLRNGWPRVTAAANPRAALRRRFEIAAHAAGLDRARARTWARARAVGDLLYAVEFGDTEGVSRPVSAAIHDWLA
ncbi:MAG TPA: aminoglycoside phosphotransferase family protein [Actinocrinis sp.]|nr:aminoglycoside phosphotransferase family protein [Actinocrinis sp.]